jgi:hypothetical protein
VADARQFSLHIGRRHHVPIRKVPEVEFHAGLEAPFQRHVMNGDRRLLLAARVHGAVEVIRRIQVGAVVRRELHALDCPGLAVRQILTAQPREEGRDLLEGLVMREVLDLRCECRRVGLHVVFQEDREVDELAGHAISFPATKVRARS